MKKLQGSHIRFFICTAFLFAILSLTNGCKNDSEDAPGANEVLIQGMAFSPSSITVSSGTTITWTNKDGMDHSVTSNTSIFDSGPISNNGTYSHTFNTAGTFPYHCMVHPDMTGTVTVN
jgi:plastocyanin